MCCLILLIMSVLGLLLRQLSSSSDSPNMYQFVKLPFLMLLTDF